MNEQQKLVSEEGRKERERAENEKELQFKLDTRDKMFEQQEKSKKIKKWENKQEEYY